MSSFYPLRVQFLFTVARFLCRPPGLEFRENSRERGPRSSENRSQGLRPPWGVHASPRRSGGAGRGGSPSGSRAPGGGAHPGRAAAARGTASGVKRAGSRSRCGRRAGKSRAAGAKAGGFAGKRRTAGAFRAAAGAKAGGNRENRAAAARRRRLPAGFCRENSGAAGRKRRVSGLWMAKRGEKSPQTAGFGRKTGRGSAYSGRRVTGSLFFQSRAPDAIPFAPI